MAIYDRALELEEIAHYYQMGASDNALGARANKIPSHCTRLARAMALKLLTFPVTDRPLNLTLYPGSHFRWLQGRNGVEISQSSGS